ncbi:hypothetical protein [Celeribacter sp. SCSIO 80788]|uniref:hypothetical protein n=1 Tax=Celeribacter sp. SCSIO 80788 TaxID=3117013 RepID=UPI003DA33C53
MKSRRGLQEEKRAFGGFFHREAKSQVPDRMCQPAHVAVMAGANLPQGLMMFFEYIFDVD